MARRTIDILVGTAALVALGPLLIAVACLIVIESPGNPIYLARRVGRQGRTFRMWKFRSMVKNASFKGAAITSRGDTRITRMGALLRRTKVDELPQFVNVVLGDMTLVGPRPESPELVARYTDAQRAILSVKPGVTGPVQLQSGEESDRIPESVDANEYYVSQLMNDKVQGDLAYIESRTPMSDIKVVVATAMYVVRACVARQS